MRDSLRMTGGGITITAIKSPSAWKIAGGVLSLSVRIKTVDYDELLTMVSVAGAKTITNYGETYRGDILVIKSVATAPRFGYCDVDIECSDDGVQVDGRFSTTSVTSWEQGRTGIISFGAFFAEADAKAIATTAEKTTVVYGGDTFSGYLSVDRVVKTPAGWSVDAKLYTALAAINIEGVSSLDTPSGFAVKTSRRLETVALDNGGTLLSDKGVAVDSETITFSAKFTKTQAAAIKAAIGAGRVTMDYDGVTYSNRLLVINDELSNGAGVVTLNITAYKAQTIEGAGTWAESQLCTLRLRLA